MAQIAPLPSPRFDWRRATQVIWLAGAGGLLVFSLVAYARTMRRMRRGVVPADESLSSLLAETIVTSGLRRAPRLLVSTGIRSPAVTGLFRPTLLLPAEFPGAFTYEEARLVLLHELTHLKRQDLPLNWLLCLLQAIHWCNPVLWFVFVRIRADRETACDEQVLAASKDDYRADYGHALLKLEDGLAPSGLSLGFLGIFERAAGLRARISAVAAYRRANPAWAILGMGLIAVLILVGATRAQDTPPPPGAPAAKAEEKAPAANSDRSRILFQESIQSAGKAFFASAVNTKLQRKDPQIARILNKLQTTIVPKLQFREVSIRDAIEILSQKCVELDTTEPDPTKRGVSFAFSLDEPTLPVARGVTVFPGVNPAETRITISLAEIPAMEALKYITGLGGLTFRVTQDGVSIVPPGYGRGINLSKEWTLMDDLLNGAIRVSIDAKLDSIVIPKLDFKNITLREALTFLRKNSVELDSVETDASKKGVSIFLKGGNPPQPAPNIPGLEPIPSGGGMPASMLGEKVINLSLNNATLRQALKGVASSAGLQLRVELNAVALVSGEAGNLIPKEYPMSDAIWTQLGLKEGENPREFLKREGITFPEWSSLVYIRTAGKLIMRNTQENLDRIEEMIEKAKKELPK